MTLSNMVLVKIGAIGGIATVTMGLLLRNKLSYSIQQTEYYKDALKTLRQHNGAVYLLGEPIKDKKIDISDSQTNFTKGSNAQYKVPIKGTKKSGYLYFWAEKEKEGEQWKVIRMELELDSDSNRRLLLKTVDPKKKGTRNTYLFKNDDD